MIETKIERHGKEERENVSLNQLSVTGKEME